MSSYAGTRQKRNNTLTMGNAGYRHYSNESRTEKKTKGLSRSGKILVILALAAIMIIFSMVSLSAYISELQCDNNVLAEQNASLQADIDSLENQINEETKVTKIEKTATEKYGMVYPTSDNCITIDDGELTGDSLASVIKSEAYN